MMKESTSVNEPKIFDEHKRLVENLRSNRAKVGEGCGRRGKK